MPEKGQNARNAQDLPPYWFSKIRFFCIWVGTINCTDVELPPPVSIIPLFNLIDPVDLIHLTLTHTGAFDIYTDIRLQVPMSVCP